MSDECKSDLEIRPASTSLRHRAALLVNLGLLVSVGVSALALLPAPLFPDDRFSIRLGAGLAVFAFLDASFWLSGWPGSALGVSLLGIAIAFLVLVGRSLGLAGTALSVLMGALVVLLMMSDLPALRDGEWSTDGPLPVYLGLLANATVLAITAALWLSYGRGTVGP